MKTAAQAAANWEQSAGRAATSYNEGVQSYNGDWAGATVAQESALVQGFTQAVSRGDWRRGVSAVGTAGWKSRTQAKASNYTTGFTAGADRQRVAIGKIMNELSTIVPNLPARGTYEQNKIRATTLMDALHSRKGQLGAT